MYVYESGQLISTPHDKDANTEINVGEIQLGATPLQVKNEIKTCIITFLNEKGSKFSFNKEKSPKGFRAVNIQLVK